MAQTIGIVDDDEGVGNSLGAMLRVFGLKTHIFVCAEDMLEAPEQRDLDLLLTDLTLPGISGLELISELERRGRRLPVIVMTGNMGELTREEALSRGAVDFFEKPCRADALLEAVQAVLSQ